MRATETIRSRLFHDGGAAAFTGRSHAASPMNDTNNVGWDRLSALLDELLDMEGSGPRTERLDRLRREEPRLADEVARLLNERSAIHRQQFLENGPNPWSPAGRSVGGYTLERPLGEGGMGCVWLARRSDGRFEGRAAIKLLN